MMTKKSVIISFTILLPVFSISQKQSNIWYFGDYAGIDFSSGSPVALNDNAMWIFEGCASLCNNDGNLLFYTNGNLVYNKNHALIDTIGGSWTAVRGVVAFPAPGSDHEYYLFTTGATWDSYLKWHVLDMNLNGGLGGTVFKDSIISSYTTAEQVAAVRHENGMDYWVATIDLDTTGGNVCDSIHIYRVTSMGIDTHLVFDYNDDTYSCELKFSPDRRKLSTSYSIYDFDPSTGILSNRVDIMAYKWNVYASFSPNSRYLYLNDNGRLFQYDTYASNIPGSRITIASMAAFGESGQLQLAPDGKLYCAQQGFDPKQTRLSVVNCPNKRGAGCNFVKDQFTLAAGTGCSFGLPNLLDHYFERYDSACGTVPVRADYTYLSNCYGDSTEFVDLSFNATSWSWNFDDPSSGTANTSTNQNPKHVFASAGIYDVQLAVSDGITNDTIIYDVQMIDCTILPVEILSFRGNNESGSIILNWTTANETNNDYFIIERCRDGIEFEKIGMVKGNGTVNTPSSYIHKDNSPYPGANYYRLKQVDFNSSQSTSKTIVVHADETGKWIQIYPNPASDYITIETAIQQEHALIYSVYDLQGRRILYGYNNSRDDASHQHPYLLVDISALSSGVYWIELTSDGWIERNKFIKE